MVIQARLDRMEQPDSRGQEGQTALLEVQDLVAQPGLQDLKVTLDLEVTRDSAANKALQVTQDLPDLLDPRASKVNPVYRELADCPEILGHQVRLDRKEIAELQATPERKA